MSYFSTLNDCAWPATAVTTHTAATAPAQRRNVVISGLFMSGAYRNDAIIDPRNCRSVHDSVVRAGGALTCAAAEMAGTCAGCRIPIDGTGIEICRCMTPFDFGRRLVRFGFPFVLLALASPAWSQEQ